MPRSSRRANGHLQSSTDSSPSVSTFRLPPHCNRLQTPCPAVPLPVPPALPPVPPLLRLFVGILLLLQLQPLLCILVIFLVLLFIPSPGCGPESSSGGRNGEVTPLAGPSYYAILCALLSARKSLLEKLRTMDAGSLVSYQRGRQRLSPPQHPRRSSLFGWAREAVLSWEM